MATARGQDTIQVLVHMKHGREEILGIQYNEIVKRRKLRRKLWKRRRKLRSKLLRRRLMMMRNIMMMRKMRRRAEKRKEIELKGGKQNRTTL
jgi:hypothetical protein